VGLHGFTELMQSDRDECIFREVWHDCWKSLFLFGSLLIGIMVLGSLARWLGLVLFLIFALVTVKDIVRLLMAVGLGVLVLPFTIMAALKIVPSGDQHGVGNEAYLLNANAIIVMQLFVLVAYNLFLYNYLLSPETVAFSRAVLSPP
jgi:hypothetical protein